MVAAIQVHFDNIYFALFGRFGINLFNKKVLHELKNWLGVRTVIHQEVGWLFSVKAVEK